MAAAQNIANIILHVVLLAAAIATMFFVYGTAVEQKVVTSQVDNLVSDMTQDLTIFLPETDKQSMVKVFQSLSPPDMSEEDKKAADNNKKLLKKAVMIIGGMFLAGIIIAFILSLIYKFSFLDMLKENIVVLLVAIGVEVFFLSIFARRYISLDPNLVKLNVIRSLQIYANQA